MHHVRNSMAVLTMLGAIASAQPADKKPTKAPAAKDPPAKGAPAPKQDAPPPPPPEVKKTVDAFVGTWAFDGTVTGVPGASGPIKLKEAFTCKKAAAGHAVYCAGKATVPGMGTMEDALTVVYDVEGKVVRFFGTSSMGEVHDHRCTWKDDKTIGCEPLAITVDGKPATVALDASWPDAKSVKLTETTTMKDGSKMTFDGTGKRK